MGSRARRSHANQPIARITAKWGLRKYHNSNRCIFEICICLSSFQLHGSKHSESHNWYYDKTRLRTYFHYDRQRKWFVSQVIHEVADILSIKLKHATATHAQTIGVLERPTPQSRLLWKWHQANIGNVGMNIYPLQSWITTRHTIPALILDQAEYFTAESHTISYITNLDYDLLPIPRPLQTLQKN